jgi:uncharacterized protein (DUF1697 family)
MSIKLIETVEDRKDGFGFLFEILSTCHILHYDELLISKEDLKKYLKDNPFPEDKEYSEEDFIHDFDSEGAVSVFVEKRETAEYIAILLGELI